MLRNACNVRLLRRLCLHNPTAAVPAADVTVSNTWRRRYTLEVTSRETSDGTDKPAGSTRLERASAKSHRSKRALKGKVLHSRVLSDDEKAQQAQLRRQVQMQSEEDVFGPLAGASTFTKSQPEKRAKHKRSPVENENGQKGRELKEKQVDLATSEGVGVGVGSEDAPEDWADSFGTMAEPSELRLPRDTLNHQRENNAEETLESDDEDDHIPLREYGRSGHNATWYGRQIEKLGKQGKVYEAIQMLDKTMLAEDRVAPNEYVFTVVIGICGRAGYTKKAFSLFNKMKKYGVVPDMPAYTALFNACANSPWKEDGIARANKLLRHMQEKEIEPNTLTLKAVIKAYGRMGELQTAFSIVDQMLEGGHVLDAEGWSHLLMACISDKEAGLKHAIEVWRLMRKKKVQPQIYQYNLLIRAARDCGVGDTQFANQLVRSATKEVRGGATVDTEGATDSLSPTSGEAERSPSHTPGAASSHLPPVQDVSEPQPHRPWWEEDTHKGRAQDTNVPQNAATFTSNRTTPQSVATLDMLPRHEKQAISILDSLVPNILNPRGVRRPQDGSVVGLGALDTPPARLALLGGVPGVLSHMARDGVRPDIRTFAQLLDMVPREAEAEEDVLVAMTSHDVRPDTDLLNSIIRRRCQRRDLESARDVLALFTTMGLVPNLMTYASLALGCDDYLSGNLLLRDMQRAGFEPTVDIFGILLRRSAWDFRYKKTLCEQMLELGVSPNAAIIKQLEADVAMARKTIVKKERGERVEPHFARSKFPEEFKMFMLFYKKWLLNSSLEQPEHPWNQYRQPTGGHADTEQQEHKR